METSLEELINSYKELSDEELLNLHASGELTEVAYNVLETEISRREISVPTRPAEKAEQHEESFFRSHWEGKASLASAYWLLGVLGGFAISVVQKIIAAQELLIFNVFFSLFCATYFAFVCVSIWRCAWNTRWMGWGVLARFYVVIIAIGLAIELIRTFL